MFKLRMLTNNRGCWGGGGSPEPPAPTKPPDPAPTPTPSDVSPQISQEERRRKLKNLRFGLASTIKTSSKGISGAGADLTNRSLQGKKKLGE